MRGQNGTIEIGPGHSTEIHVPIRIPPYLHLMACQIDAWLEGGANPAIQLLRVEPRVVDRARQIVSTQRSTRQSDG